MLRILLSLFCYFVFSGAVAQNLSDGLVACYSFSGNANDGSGNNNNGSVHGAVLTTDRYGNPNSAYQFNGIGNYISIPSTGLALPAFTYSAWMLVTTFPAVGANSYILSVGSSSTFDQGLLITSDAGCPFPYCFSIGTEMYVADQALSFTGVEQGFQIAPTQQWFHLAITVTDSISHSYLNGVLFGTQRFYSSATAAYGFPLTGNIGARCDLTQFFSGAIDDISIYNRGLTTQEVQLLYHRGYACTPTPPVIQDIAFCGNGSALLTAKGNAQFHWYDSPVGGTLLFSGNPFVTPDLTVTTNYYVSSIVDTTETSRTKVTVSIHASPQLLCKDSIHGSVLQPDSLFASVQSGMQPFSYFVDFGDGSQSTTASTPITHSYSQAGFYTISIKVTDANNCTVTCSEINQILTTPVVQNSTLCNSGSVSLQAAGGTAYRWYDARAGGHFLFEGNPFITPSLSETTVYYVSNLVNSIESTRTKVTAFVAPSPSLTCSVPSEAPLNQPVTFGISVASGTPPFEYAVTFGDGSTGNELPSSLMHQYNGEGSYLFSVTISDSNDCTASCSKDIKLFPILIPNVITVNGDSLNNRFTIFEKTANTFLPYSGPLPFSMLIMNRWGEMIYQTTDSSKGWQGDNANTGVYYYTIIFGNSNYKGWLSILK